MRPPGPPSATLPRMPRRPRLPSLRRRRQPAEPAGAAPEATPSPPTPPPPPTPARQTETAAAARRSGPRRRRGHGARGQAATGAAPDAAVAVARLVAAAAGRPRGARRRRDRVRRRLPGLRRRRTTGDRLGPAPSIVVESAPQPEAAEEIGFPEFATRNTTRVGGADAIASAAGVALASYPSLGGVGGPGAVTSPRRTPGRRRWRRPRWPPIRSRRRSCCRDPDEVPELTAKALGGALADRARGGRRRPGIRRRRRRRSRGPRDRGDRGQPTRPRSRRGSTPSAPGSPARRTRARSSWSAPRRPAFAMPAAAWAARSGDPILFAAGERVPDATLEVDPRARQDADLRARPRVRDRSEGGQGARAAGRVGDEDRRLGGSGRELDRLRALHRRRLRLEHQRSRTRLRRSPTRAARSTPPPPRRCRRAASPDRCSSPRTARTSRRASEGFFSDTQPGFVDDPSRALYNHVWLIGDTDALSVAFQAQVDELTKLAPVSAPAPRGPSSDRSRERPRTSPPPVDGGGGLEGRRQRRTADRLHAAMSEAERADRRDPGHRPASRTSAPSRAPRPPTSRSRSATGSRR